LRSREGSFIGLYE